MGWRRHCGVLLQRVGQSQWGRERRIAIEEFRMASASVRCQSGGNARPVFSISSVFFFRSEYRHDDEVQSCQHVISHSSADRTSEPFVSDSAVSVRPASDITL